MDLMIKLLQININFGDGIGEFDAFKVVTRICSVRPVILEYY